MKRAILKLFQTFVEDTKALGHDVGPRDFVQKDLAQLVALVVDASLAEVAVTTLTGCLLYTSDAADDM
eukprot:2081119-Lingulodinium_polyedra.AAC.1